MPVVELGTTALVTANATTATSASFTPTANSLMVAYVGAGNGAGAAWSAGVVTDTAGTTWTRVAIDGGSFTGSAEIWVADAGASPVARTVTWDPGGTVASGLILMVKWNSGAKSRTLQPGTTSVNGFGTAYSRAITPSATGSLLAGAFGRGTDNQVLTATAATTALGSINGSAGDTAGIFRGTSTTTASSAVTVGYTNAAGGNNAIAVAEILATTTAGPVPSPRTRRWALRPRPARRATPTPEQIFPPADFVSPRRRAVRLARARVFKVPPQQVVPAAPAYPPQSERSRVRGLRLFRPRVSVPPPEQLDPTGQQRLRLRAPRLARGRAVAPVPSQIVPPPPYPPESVRTRVRGLRLFRPRAAAAPADAYGPAARVQRPRLRLPRLTRSHVATPAPVQLAPAAPSYPPAPVRIRVRGLRLFRGRAAVVPPPQVALVAPAYVPASVRSRVRGLRLFRGRSASVVPPQIAVAPPSYVPLDVRLRLKVARLFRARAAAPVADQAVARSAPRLRPRVVSPRRGHVAMPPPPQVVVAAPAYPPRPVRPRLRGLRLARGRTAAPVPPQIVLVPPKQVPLFARLKQHAARIFRGQTRTPVVEVCDCTTHRPNLGTTTRPGSGITARPGSGTTNRPAMGMTARPNDGTTTRPCSCND